MVVVLTDVYLTEAILQNLDKKKKSDWLRGLNDPIFQDLAYGHILEKHHISEEDFYTSIAHYSQQYKTFAKIYEQVELNFKSLLEEAIQRDLIKKQQLKLAEEEARLIAALDTASYIKWFEVWSPDSLSNQTDSTFFVQEKACCPYIRLFWLDSLAKDTIIWSVVDFIPFKSVVLTEESPVKVLPRELLKNVVNIEEQ